MTFDRVRNSVWIDDPSLDAAEYQRARISMARWNRFTGIADGLYRQIARYQIAHRGRRPLRVLDVSTGNGDLAVRWAVQAARHRCDLHITSVDPNAHSIAEQQRLAKQSQVEVQSVQLDCIASPLPCGFDVVVCSMLMHRLDEAQAFRLLQSIQFSAQQAVIVCDLNRSRLNHALVKLASRLCTRSHVYRHDAVAGIQAAFSEQEISRIAQSALARPIQLRPLFPCHFLLVADETVDPVVASAFA
ncbi:hypothetical protein Pla52o_00420 [Novipirellula galeiformis]|uniref:Methyltransferase domain-containing protein n=1 Tax=Novipirellula galeiformis TaxID=2528004 RepID=A0A5C6CNT4_9BACT|nr:methyltransferase domain-containing protein [Novipirellula galeiformis]TWU26190.1 hypothetical protein Pla52o_00420 [Novipirellula galeiformis]